MIDRRRRLLDASPDSPQRAEWLLDQAEDLLLLLLPSDGSDLLALFGRPPDAERRRAIDLMREALACLRESAAERSRPRSEPAVGDATLAARREAMLRGMVLAMLAECDDDEDATMRRQEAVAALTPLILDLDGGARRLAQTHLAMALAGLDRPDEALTLLNLLIEDAATSALDRLRAQMAAAAALSRAGDLREASRRLAALADRSPEGAVERPRRDGAGAPGSGVHGSGGELFRRLLATDALVNLRRIDPDPAPAWVPYRSLLDNAPAAERRILRPLLLARTAVLGSEAGMDGSRPPFEALAIVLHDQDQQRPAEAVEPLRGLLAREDLPALERALAGLALGEALAATGESQQATEVLLAAATGSRGEPEALECASRAAELASRTWRAALHEPSTRDLARRTFDRILGDFPDLPELDRWRLEAANLSLADGRTADAAALLAAIPPSSPQRRAADLVAAEMLVADARSTGTDSPATQAGLPPGDPQSRWRRALAAIDALAADGSGDAFRSRRALLRGEAHLALGQPRSALEDLAAIAIGDDEVGLHAWLLTLQALQAADALDDAAPRALAIARTGGAATVLRVLVVRLSELDQACAALDEEDRRPEARSLGRLQMLPLAQAADAVLASGAALPVELRSTAQRLAARGMLRGGRPTEALRLIAPLVEEHPDVLEDLATRAEALIELAVRSAPKAAAAPAPDAAPLTEAMMLLKRIAAARRDRRDRFFWMAETLQLEILRHLDRGTEQIAPRVEQLRRIDPQLGGPGWRRRLEAAAMESAPPTTAPSEPPPATTPPAS